MARPGKAATVRLGSSQSARPASRAGLDDASQLRPRTTTPGAGTLFGLDGCSRPSSRAEPRLGSHASRQASRPVSREAGMGAGPSGRGAHRAAGGHPHGEHADARGTPQRSHRHLRAAHRLHLDTEDDSSSSSSSDFSRLEIAALDTSLAEEMQAEPQQGTVLRYATFCCRLCVCVQQHSTLRLKALNVPSCSCLVRRVDNWIADLESKYAGLGVDPSSPEHADSSIESDPKVLKDNVRKYLAEVPFPAWDGDDTPIAQPERVPTPPPVYHDYEPDLLRADDEPEDADADDRDAGARLVRAYGSSCLKHSKTALPQAIEALSRRRVETLAIPNCSIADGGMAALGPFLGELKGLTTLDLSTNMIFDEGATALAKALKPCATLTSLQLDHNKIGTYGATALAEHFKRKKCNLTYLSVAHNQLRCEYRSLLDAVSSRCKRDLAWRPAPRLRAHPFVMQRAPKMF
jgi:hypothetical protein